VSASRRGGGSGTDLRPATSAEVSDVLDGAAFIQYVASHDRLAAVVVTQASASLHDLGDLTEVEGALDTLAFGLRRLLAGFGTARGLVSSSDAVRRACEVLDARLLGSLAHRLGDRPFVLCPTSRLNEVPWSLLPTARQRTLRVTPSATIWLRAVRATAQPSPRAGVVSVAGPGLPGAALEVADVTRLHPGARSLVGAEATVDAVLTALRRCRLAHLAAHGLLRADNPLFSSLTMSDGPLTCYDLERLHTVPPTVVMSACSSGSGKADVADEVLGLATTLLTLGATSVVAPLFAVPDDATRPLMVDLHRHLATGLSAAQALANVQASVDRSDSVATATAGAFVALGA